LKGKDLDGIFNHEICEISVKWKKHLTTSAVATAMADGQELRDHKDKFILLAVVHLLALPRTLSRLMLSVAKSLPYLLVDKGGGGGIIMAWREIN
jgi:hypothetical protein